MMLAKVVIHLGNGGDRQLYNWFFTKLRDQNVPFDVIGVSFYPSWHGPLTDLQNNLLYCVTEFGKDISVVETGYPWTLILFDNENNLVGLDNQLLPGYATTPAGQAAFVSAVKDIVVNFPNGRGLGVVCWAGDWITSNTFTSAWENVALFKNTGNNLPALDVLGSPTPLPTPPPATLPTPRSTPPPTSRPTTRPTSRRMPRPVRN